MTEQNQDLSFLENEKQEVQENDLERLKNLVDTHQGISDSIAKLEEQLKTQKATLRELSETSIPTLLYSKGLSQIKLASGEKVNIKSEISATIQDNEAFTKFLMERGDDNIIKLQVNFERMAPQQRKELFKALNTLEEEVTFSAKDSIHAATLKKYVKDVTGFGEKDRDLYKEKLDSDIYVGMEELEKYLKVYKYFKTTIK